MAAVGFFFVSEELLGLLGLAASALAAIGIINKVKDGYQVDSAVKAHIDKKQNEMTCCCSAIGPSGKFKNHFIMCKSRKEAEDKARHYGNANGVELHTRNTKDSYPHFHPTRNGKKISGVHFQFNE